MWPDDFDPNLASASTPPSEMYYDASHLEREQRAVFARSWQLVGSAAQLPEPGSYFTATIAGEPVLVVRGRDGEVRAMSNVCRHRAGPVAYGEGKCRSFQCRYHGWMYGLDGRLLAMPEFDGVENFSKEDYGLPQFRVAEWANLLFVAVDAATPPFEEVMGEVVARLARRNLQEFRHAARRDWFLDCNWKVYVDNYLEGYHIPIVHPSLHEELDYDRYRTITSRWWSLQDSPIRNARRLRTTGDEYGDEAEYFWVWPNLMLNVYPDNFSTNLIVPLGPERTLTVFEWFFRDPGAAGVRQKIDETVRFSDEVQLEDVAICEAVQRGLKSRTYDRGRYSIRRENGVHHFHSLLAEALRS